jgi:hypothetical protein
MVVRIWRVAALVIAALAGSAAVAWFTWPTLPTLPTYQYEAAGDGSYRPGGAACEPNAIAYTFNLAEAAAKRDACAKEAEEHRLSAGDLVQQMRAADAAAAQVALSAQALWMTFFQTVGGFLTLVAATAAAVYARSAAVTAETVARLQLASSPHLGDAYAEFKGNSVEYILVVRNYGQRSITFVGTRIEFLFSNGDISFVDSTIGYRQLEMLVGPNDIGEINGKITKPVRFDPANTTSIFLDYSLIYNDVHGVEHKIFFPLTAEIAAGHHKADFTWRPKHVEGDTTVDDRPLREQPELQKYFDRSIPL